MAKTRSVISYLTHLCNIAVIFMWVTGCESATNAKHGNQLQGASGTTEAPTFSLSSGTYKSGTLLELATKTPAGEIYYTTNGDIPTEKSIRYTSRITLLTSQTIKALAVKSNMRPSTVVSADYVIVPATLGAVSEPVALPAERIFNNNVSVTLSAIPLAATIYYSIDGSEPSIPYTGAIELNQSTRIKAKASLADYTDSPVMDQTFNFKVSDPVFSVQDSTSHTMQISTITNGATIYYTLDGSDPFDGSNLSVAAIPYASPFTISNGQPLKAVAIHPGYANSAVVPFVDDGKLYNNGQLVNGYINDKTVLLLHMDGSDGSTTFTDASSHGQVVTSIGNASISTAQSKFGGSSAYFDGASELSVPSTLADIPSGTDFTIEAWIYPLISDQFGIFGSAEYDTLNLAVSGDALGLDRANHDGGTYASGTIAANVWQHVAAVRSGNTARVFVDGVLRSEFEFPYDFSAPSSLGIGHLAGESGWWANGYIDEVRITKGQARYTSNFTPPSAAFESSSGCYVAGVKTTDVVNGSGHCNGDQTYYIAGSAMPGLNSSGTGLSTSNNKYYVNATVATGFYDNACYDQGLDTGSVSNGTGFCSPDGQYYIDSIARPGLDSSGTGICSNDGKYYVGGVLANGVIEISSVLLHKITNEDGSVTLKDPATGPRTFPGQLWVKTTPTSPTGMNAWVEDVSLPGAFTIETWAKFDDTSGGSFFGARPYLGGFRHFEFGNNPQPGYGITFSYGQNCALSCSDRTKNDQNVSLYTGYIPQSGEWHHYAVSRDDRFDWRIFIDGVETPFQIAEQLASFHQDDVISYSGLVVPSLGSGLNGALAGFRITEGKARYTSAFSPPSQNFSNPIGSHVCYAGGINQNSLTAGTGYCTGDQTYYIASTAMPGLNSSGTGFSTSDNKYYVNATRASGFYDNACYAQGMNTGGVVNGTGYCLANDTYYIDGVAQPGLDSIGSGINSNNNKYYVNGSIANGYVPDAKSSLLLHMDGADGSTTYSDSSSNPQTIVAQGSATLSSAQSKFGNASMVTNDAGWITNDSAAITPNGSEDFTVEMWIRFRSSPSWRVLLTSVNRTQGAFQIGFNEHTALVGPLDVGWDLQAQHTMSLDDTQWHHFAVARSNGTLRVYQDGNLIGQTNTPSDYNSADGLSLGGAYWAGPQSIDVYIDEVRFTKGRARYTGNFAPPSAAFDPSDSSVGCYVAGVKTTDVVNGSGYCNGDQTYYIASTAMPGLNSSGTGLSTSDNKYYVNATRASGFYENTCYAQGMNTGGVVNGTGYCIADGKYYIQGIEQPGLDATGTGTNSDTGKYYQDGIVANGVVGGLLSADPNTVLLLHMDGQNGSSTFLDSSPSPKTLSPSGNVSISGSQYKFGGGSASFDGSSYLNIDSPGAELQFTGPFTMETPSVSGWVRQFSRI